MADGILLARAGLDLCILRPGLVVGKDGLAFHSGLGFFNNEQHCIGWNSGRNSLPYLLVEGVADAIVRAAGADRFGGRCFNLVGDVRPTARDFIAALARSMQRPLKFHPQSVDLLWLGEYAKFVVRCVTGRRVPPPSRRDLLSRGLIARFDCSDAKRDLGWSLVADPQRFHERAILFHAA